jgi:hypothetical protein
MFYGFETKKVTETLPSHWSYLDEPVKGLRPKTLPIPSLAGSGVTSADFSKR